MDWEEYQKHRGEQVYWTAAWIAYLLKVAQQTQLCEDQLKGSGGNQKPNNSLDSKIEILHKALQERRDSCAAAPITNNYPLLDDLFGSGLSTAIADIWKKELGSTILAQPQFEEFLGKNRVADIVPPRELTFQSILALPPNQWRVVVIGQSPYPRPESATGIAMMDNSLVDWNDKRFSAISTMRALIKAACKWKYPESITGNETVAEIRNVLKKSRAVGPQEWFHAMLTQGVLLMNSALTVHTEQNTSAQTYVNPRGHSNFWRPIVYKIISTILEYKSKSPIPEEREVLFCWWGAFAVSLMKTIQKMSDQYPGVKVMHIETCNPAAMGDVFASGHHFRDINEKISKKIEFLPSVDWDTNMKEASNTMKQFVQKTVDTHRSLLERMMDLTNEKVEDNVSETFVVKSHSLSFAKTLHFVEDQIQNIQTLISQVGCTENKLNLPQDQHQAIVLYTMDSDFYRILNKTLRCRIKGKMECFFPYLYLFLSGLSSIRKLQTSSITQTLYRGVPVDLSSSYKQDARFVWTGISSCTKNRQIAEEFSSNGNKNGDGKIARTIFIITTHNGIDISAISKFPEQEEVIIRPGSRFRVMDRRIVGPTLEISLNDITTRPVFVESL